MTMIQITNLDQLEGLINCLSKDGNINGYAKKRVARDNEIDTIIAIVKKCRSMINDLERQSESTKEALGWLQGAVKVLTQAKDEF